MGCRGVVANPQHLKPTTAFVKIPLNPPFLHQKEDMRWSGRLWRPRVEGSLRAERSIPGAAGGLWAGSSPSRSAAPPRAPVRLRVGVGARAGAGAGAARWRSGRRVPVIVPKYLTLGEPALSLSRLFGWASPSPACPPRQRPRGFSTSPHGFHLSPHSKAPPSTG